MMKNFFRLLTVFIFLAFQFFVIQGKATNSNIRILAQGSQSSVEKPFIFVARDGETYAQLKNLVRDLPDASQFNFKTTAIIAAFAGTKPTGGYGVEFQKANNKFTVNLTSPGKGKFVTQILTQPYKIAAIAVAADEPLDFLLSTDWKQNKEAFTIQKGYFSYSGGIAGIKKDFKVAGKMWMWKYENYVTVLFNIYGIKNSRNRNLNDYASGVLHENKIRFSLVNAGTFIEKPHPPFFAEGNFAEENLNLNFKSQKTTFADGFTGEGVITAVKN